VPAIGIVAIGRNEGPRLERCLRSLPFGDARVIYVDSGSSDNSVHLARSVGADVVELDPTLPFSAGRARNEGAKRLLERSPSLEFIQFIDGDCELDPTWLQTAARLLSSKPDVAVAGGRRREIAPDASIYNRLCDLEWGAPSGEVTWIGGDFLIRGAAFQAVGGFDPSVRAGEEPELCNRLRQKGWKIMRLAEPMTRHDAQLLRFSQWWRRQIRTGYGGLDVAWRFKLPQFISQVRSTLTWVLGFPILAAVAASIGLFLGSRLLAAAVPGLILLGIPAQMARIAYRTYRSGQPPLVACMDGLLGMTSKLAQAWGYCLYFRDRVFSGGTRLVEYKTAAPPANPDSATPIHPRANAVK
jgi:GT2 family glycosyltransferase